MQDELFLLVILAFPSCNSSSLLLRLFLSRFFAFKFRLAIPSRNFVLQFRLRLRLRFSLVLVVAWICSRKIHASASFWCRLQCTITALCRFDSRYVLQLFLLGFLLHKIISSLWKIFYTFEMLRLSLNNLSKTWSYINILQVRRDKILYFIIKIHDYEWLIVLVFYLRGVYKHIIKSVFIYDNWLEIFSFVVGDLFAFWLHKFDKNP